MQRFVGQRLLSFVPSRRSVSTCSWKMHDPSVTERDCSASR